MNVGDVIVSGPEAAIQTGNALPLELIPLGTIVHNIELEPGRGGKWFVQQVTLHRLWLKKATM